MIYGLDPHFAMYISDLETIKMTKIEGEKWIGQNLENKHLNYYIVCKL